MLLRPNGCTQRRIAAVSGVALYQERKTTVSPLDYQKRADLSRQVSFSGNNEPLIGEISKSDTPAWPERAFLENCFDSV